ncbi:hypothetical protein Asi02nite_55300 [Asanoa siamensis]|uniref:Uncharacterized protein n=1 Tax=Asanoa siamensis TaxID=926357 RepID=A0ABQ4CYT6_9ACTN|nr:hypothetical protein Asi02nite_55300 [Asanoa siamensis]
MAVEVDGVTHPFDRATRIATRCGDRKSSRYGRPTAAPPGDAFWRFWNASAPAKLGGIRIAAFPLLASALTDRLIARFTTAGCWPGRWPTRPACRPGWSSRRTAGREHGGGHDERLVRGAERDRAGLRQRAGPTGLMGRVAAASRSLAYGCTALRP